MVSMRFRPPAVLAALAVVAAGCVRTAPPPPRPATAHVYVAATTDVHGYLRGWDYRYNAPDTTRGLARAATVVDSLRAEHPGQVVLVDAGDLLQGSPIAYLATRAAPETPDPIVAAMNAMRYDAAAIGNHEFNYGLERLGRAIAQAGFPFLAANALTPAGERAYPGWTIVERGGVKVGIVGATTPGSMIWDRDHLAGRVEVRDGVPAVARAAEEARAAGADVVVAVVHAGLDGASSYDTVSTGVASENFAARIAHEVPGIAAIVYGHSHGEGSDTTIASTLLVQPRYRAGSVGLAHLVLEREGDDWRVVAREGAVIPTAGREESPAVVAATQRAHLEALAYATSPLGETPVAWRADSARVADTPLVDFVLEVERRATGADLASTAAFTVAGGLGPGPITHGDLARLYPYDNTLRVVRISGRQLREYLEHSARYYVGWPPAAGRVIDPEVPGFNFDIVAGADYTLDLTRPVGERVTRLEVRGRPVAPTDTFTLALNNYRQTGGGGYAMLRDAPLVPGPEPEVRQLLIEEVRRRGTIRPEDYFQRNWRIVPDEAAAAAYEAMHGPSTRGSSP